MVSIMKVALFDFSPDFYSVSLTRYPDATGGTKVSRAALVHAEYSGAARGNVKKIKKKRKEFAGVR
jgi:hypothetical protein